MTVEATIRMNICTTAKSRTPIEVMNSRPAPGQANTVSITTEPPISQPS